MPFHIFDFIENESLLGLFDIIMGEKDSNKEIIEIKSKINDFLFQNFS